MGLGTTIRIEGLMEPDGTRWYNKAARANRPKRRIHCWFLLINGLKSFHRANTVGGFGILNKIKNNGGVNWITVYVARNFNVER